MDKVLFYVDPVSEPCRSVQMFLDATNIPYEAKIINLLTAEHRTDEYKAINPTQTVPAIAHGDLKLFESLHYLWLSKLKKLHFFGLPVSVAILIYLTDKFSTPDHWYPSDLKKRAKINEYLQWHHMNTRWKGGLLVMLKFVFLPMFLKVEVSEEEQNAAITALKETLDVFEKCFLKDNKFIAGDEISIADLMAIGELIAPDGIGIYAGKNRPKVEAWHNRVKEALGSHYDVAHKTLYELGSTLKSGLSKSIDY
ncbi:Glutathione S-transferase theta-1 [Trichoplax sp. H2]|nr:Glutathione S-transferase theta-1 [Trichoplax sp. H2]|eukprot:RDD46542.1 Glutathione S-transferase theta-1 [Trichoplax sp. H2]